MRPKFNVRDKIHAVIKMIVRSKSDPSKPLTEEQLKKIKALEEMTDDEIDFSDIPEMTKEDFDNAVCARNVYNGNFYTQSGKLAPRKLLEHVLCIGREVGHITQSQYDELYAKLPPD